MSGTTGIPLESLDKDQLKTVSKLHKLEFFSCELDLTSHMEFSCYFLIWISVFGLPSILQQAFRNMFFRLCK